MTAAPDRAVLPWAPGLDRDAAAVELELAGSVPGAVAMITAATPDLLQSVMARSTTDPDGLIRVHLSAVSPVEATFALLVPTRDAVALWSPGSDVPRDRLPTSWSDARTTSALDGVPLGCLLGRDDQPLLTFGVAPAGGALAGGAPAGGAVASGGGAVAVRAGIVEESAHLLVAVRAQIDAAGLEILLDATATRFEDAVRRVGAALGLQRPAVGPRHEEPVLCTWYALHQDVDEERLRAEGLLAAELGFRTMIVDDGWQTADEERGYASCGDWAVEPSKIPDPARLVSTLRAHGVETMWWLAMPFLGERSTARARDALPVLVDLPHLGTAVLDPRSRRVRQHLRDRLVNLLRHTGAAGLKLDFLERWAATPDGPPPDDAVGPSVPDAALSLLDDVQRALAAVVPDLLLEFREPYVGSEAVRRATMLRVADCPMSPGRNRIGVLDLRLTTAGVAVHSDPVMWAPDDSPERVAQHLHHALFGVPQVSVLLSGLRPEHRDVLRHWLTVWREHRDVLLHGTLSVAGVTDGYRAVDAVRGSTAVTVQYAPGISALPPGTHCWLLVNAHDAREVLLSGPAGRAAQVSILDSRGRPAWSSRTRLDHLTSLPVPPGGTATLVLDQPATLDRR